MRKGGGMKSGPKTFAKRGGSSAPRRAFASRSASSWGGNSWGSGSRSPGQGSRSWLSIGGSREPARDADPQGLSWDEADGTGGGSGLDLGKALGEGLAHELGNQLGGYSGESRDSAAFWRGIAVCAILVAVIVLVVSAGG